MATTLISPPILSAATFSLHQTQADKFATQGCRVRMIAARISLTCFSLYRFPVKGFDNVPQDRFQFLALGR